MTDWYPDRMPSIDEYRARVGELLAKGTKADSLREEGVMYEQEFFKILQELSTHAVGVGARQAAGDFAKRYPQYAHLQNKMEQYLHYQVLANDVGIDLHQEMVKGE